MKLYVRECRRIVGSLVYLLFVAVLIFSWHKNFQGVTKAEIDWAKGKPPASMSFDRPLLAKPEKGDAYFGSKTSEDKPEEIMTGVTRALLMEYEKNIYATYPFGMYKEVSLSSAEQERILEILCEITGLDEEQLKHLPKNYFPAVTGTIYSTATMEMDENGALVIQGESSSQMEETKETEEIEETKEAKAAKRFVPQVSYERFHELMREIEEIIGEKGSRYSKKMMVIYFGLSEMSYEEACAEYQQTVEKDKLTNGFARLFCDYMGLSLGLYPIFVIVALWLQDRQSRAAELVYIRRISSFRLVLARYLACVTAVLLPVILLSLESLVLLLRFGREQGIAIDCFAYIKYILWWLLPTVMVVLAAGMLVTLLTDLPLAIFLQFLWWLIDKGVTGLSGDTKLTTLMVRHNTLRGYEQIEDDFLLLCFNRLLMVGMSILLVAASVWVLRQKRRNAYGNAFGRIKSQFSFGYTK